MEPQSLELIKQRDPQVAAAIQGEYDRQVGTLEMIASENFASPAVLAAAGSVMTNKYAEGYPGRRWYGGCEKVDDAETLAIDRAKALFGAEYANVQPHCGSSANMAVYFAALEAGDTILSMSLDHGGHLSHGLKVNYSGRYFNIVHYGVSRETEQIDYDEVAALAREHKPRLILAGASAYPRQIDFTRFREMADEVGALLMVDMAHFAGLVAGGVHPSPVPLSDYVTSTTHKTLRGPRSGFVLCKEEYGKAIDRAIFPGLQGGPLMHVIAAKAVAFGEAQTDAFKAYAALDRGQRQDPGRHASGRWHAHRLGRHRHAPHARRRDRRRHHRQRRLAGPRKRRHHRQQKQHPLRHPETHHRQRRPHRHPRPHDARHERSRNENHRRLGSPKSSKRRRRTHHRPRPRTGAGIDQTVPVSRARVGVESQE